MIDPLVEFILARIFENEAPNLAWFAPEPEDPAEWTEWFDARAESWHTRRCGSRLSEGIIKDCECGLPASVLAECKAKRAIVETYRDERSRRDAYQTPQARAGESMSQRDMRRSSAARCRGLEIAVEFLAEAYADHPDYPQVRTCPKCGADCDMRVQVCECGPDCPLTPVHR